MSRFYSHVFYISLRLRYLYDALHRTFDNATGALLGFREEPWPLPPPLATPLPTTTFVTRQIESAHLIICKNLGTYKSTLSSDGHKNYITQFEPVLVLAVALLSVSVS